MVLVYSYVFWRLTRDDYICCLSSCSDYGFSLQLCFGNG